MIHPANDIEFPQKIHHFASPATAPVVSDAILFILFDWDGCIYIYIQLKLLALLCWIIEHLHVPNHCCEFLFSIFQWGHLWCTYINMVSYSVSTQYVSTIILECSHLIRKRVLCYVINVTLFS